MPQIRFGPCPECGQRVMRRGRSVLNIIGKPLNHSLSCTAAPTTPLARREGQEEKRTQ